MVHWTQKSREEQIDKLERLILMYGGWGQICASVGEVPFGYYAAKQLGCTIQKFKEYLALIQRAKLPEETET